LNEIFAFAFRVAVRVEEQKINVRVREQPAAAESAGGDERKIALPVGSGTGLHQDPGPEPLNHRIDQRRAPGYCGGSVTGSGKFPLDGSGFPRVQVG
jgi:hypothetical protein